jgi:hypothetical protein
MSTNKKIYLEPTPESRADKVKAIVREHWESGEDLETSVMDMVADIMHLCEIKKIDWMNLVCRAESNFEEEIYEHKQRGGKDQQCNTNAPSADIQNNERF